MPANTSSNPALGTVMNMVCCCIEWSSTTAGAPNASVSPADRTPAEGAVRAPSTLMLLLTGVLGALILLCALLKSIFSRNGLGNPLIANLVAPRPSLPYPCWQGSLSGLSAWWDWSLLVGAALDPQRPWCCGGQLHRGPSRCRGGEGECDRWRLESLCRV